MAWPELYQEYVLMAENIQDRAYYQSKDEKWALSWSSSGWGLGAADQLGKKTKISAHSLFRLLYLSTSTVQRLEISRVQSLEISRFCTLDISRRCTIEVSR